MNKQREKTKCCCFFGHREIFETDILKNTLYKVVENLIINKSVDTFFFGSKSQFNDLCYNIVSELKEKYPFIERIYVRAEFPYVDKEYIDYLLERYEYTYYPEKILNAGRAVYIERNYEMINKSNFCVVYYDENYIPIRNNKSKSGTELAYNYAVKKCEIINIFNMIEVG